LQYQRELNNMNTEEVADQFQLLENKIDRLIELIITLKKEKESFADKFQAQEKNVSDLTDKLENLKTARDNAKQRVASLLQKIEQIDIPLEDNRWKSQSE